MGIEDETGFRRWANTVLSEYLGEVGKTLTLFEAISLPNRSISLKTSLAKNVLVAPDYFHIVKSVSDIAEQILLARLRE